MTGMRLLVTGGAGCLGSNLVDHYHARGHALCVFDNFATGRRETISAQDRLLVVEGSVADKECVERLFGVFKPTHVIHSAASYKDPKNWTEDARTNVLGSINIVSAAHAHGIHRLINFQTALCYGRPSEVPVSVHHRTAPFTSYGISKTAGESYLLQSGLPVVSLRLANICAPRLSIGPIPTFYRRLKANHACVCTDSRRDFLDLHDFLALVDLVLVEDSPIGVFNVSTGEGHSIREVFDAVERHLGMVATEPTVVPVGADDVREMVLDPSATEVAFGWRASVSFQQTIANQLTWYDVHGVTAIHSHLPAKD